MTTQIPDYNFAVHCLQENLGLLADEFGNVAPENKALWNISNALIVLVDAAQESAYRNAQTQSRLTEIERRLQNLSG